MGKPIKDSERLFRYVEKFFAKHRKEKWPTVREVAHALGWKHDRIQMAIDDDWDGRLYTTSYYVEPEDPFGEHFVESFGNEEESTDAA
jgi:hypothetical protein